MKDIRLTAAAILALGIAVLGAQTQNAPAQQPKPTADPYANNPEPGHGEVPARRAGRQGQRREDAPRPGAVNQGPFDPGDLEVRTGLQRRRPARRSGIR